MRRHPPTDPGAVADGAFAALASPTRRALLDMLRDGPRPVRELAAAFDMRRPSVSEHLRVLREAGLVAEERRGRERHYRLEPAPLRDVADWLQSFEAFWRGRLANLRAHLDEEESP